MNGSSGKERSRILEACHSLPEGMYSCSWPLGGHKTYKKIAERFYWKSLGKDVLSKLVTCEHCHTANDAKFVNEAALFHPKHIQIKGKEFITFHRYCAFL